MNTFINDIKLSIKGMNRISSVYIRIGNTLIFSAALSVLVCRLMLGRAGIYDNLLMLEGELLQLTKNLIEAFYVPALFIEIAVLARRTDSAGRF